MKQLSKKKKRQQGLDLCLHVDSERLMRASLNKDPSVSHATSDTLAILFLYFVLLCVRNLEAELVCLVTMLRYLCDHDLMCFDLLHLSILYS